MAEHDAERAGSDEEREPRPTEETTAAPGGADGAPRLDEAAAWEAIVAGYGEEPPDPPGAKPFKSVEALASLEDDQVNTVPGAGDGSGEEEAPASGSPAATKPLGSSIAFAPGVAGPRDYGLAEPKDDGTEDPDDGEEGHFVPPEPPPLPEADVTAKFAWLAVIGGPVLMLLAVLMRWEMTWWLTTLCIGGFLGGFVTLVARMPSDDEEDPDPGSGAVV
ncbi:hypothetical protein [Streptomyces nitrosporeus]|uniref:DUF308 domain-containing protein n=1 Tax=Streptomyces nitrosporeus TaxID=28894 RepID=A0A5J6FEY2_9ACTN|nr:hypothetical protein [Streptomyces nitrosporeus]QEU74882.1 hypothetical protein CP967_25425 [Streptomyces nitrosporeus]GGY92806.1 hypothetical protein GCM10010327_24560 [Streptomyces nitrosporeus]